MTTETKETIQIDGITYVVEASGTPEEYEAQGLPNLAAHMRMHKLARQFCLRRLNGKQNYFAVQSINGLFSSVTSLRG